MTSIPVTNFVYDRRGNVINVMPAGASSDVVVHTRMDETSPGVASRDGVLTTGAGVPLVPIVPASTVFGYANYPATLDTLDVHKITTASPLVTITRQPEVNNRGEGTVNVATPTPVTSDSSAPLVPPVVPTGPGLLNTASGERQLARVYSGSNPPAPSSYTQPTGQVTRLVRRRHQ